MSGSTARLAAIQAVKDWALEKGATHYAHVFYPLTGPTTPAFGATVRSRAPGRRGRLEFSHASARGPTGPAWGES